MTLRKFAGLGALLSIVMPSLAMAADEVAAPVLNSGDTAWMLTATALVLFMTIPGLALFYGGMVRSKNILSVMMQCFAITGLISILWVVYGYSIAFDTTGMEQGVVNFNSFFGGMGKAFLAGVTPSSITGPAALFPEAVFITFQMTFAIITPALIVGAFAERMKFSAMLLFMAIWFTLVYAPIAHMVWSGNGGLMWDWGVLDFAGGTVVHINAGVADLIACLVLGKRKGFPTTPMAPHNLGYTLMGAASEVEYAPVPHQAAVAAPDHVRDRRVDQGEPDSHEDQHRGELHALGERTDDQRRSDDREGHLEGDEHRLREQRCRPGNARRRDTGEERLAHAAEEGVEVDHALFHTGGIERDAVAVDHPQDADQASDGEALHHHRQNIFGADHAAVEQRQAGDGHEQHEGCRGEHPGSVAGIEDWGRHFVCRHCKAWHYDGQQGS